MPVAAAPLPPAAPPVPGVPPVREELPEYRAEDIRREIDNGTVFSSLVREAEKSLGRLLSSEDLIKLFGIYDSLGLPPEVILHLVTYCIDEYRRRYGPGKVPTLRYIEKAAYTWEREGIFTLQDAERYLKRQESRRNLVGEIKRVMQITDRELLAGELKYIEGWLSLGFSTDELEIAYSRTVMQTKDFSWNYMDRIIASWHQKGLHTAEEIKAKDVKTALRKAPMKKQAMTAEEDIADIERMKKYLKELKGE
jgi:DNA replication protein DnaD